MPLILAYFAISLQLGFAIPMLIATTIGLSPHGSLGRAGSFIRFDEGVLAWSTLGPTTALTPRHGGGINRRQSCRRLACRAALFRLPSTTQPKRTQPLKITGG